MRTRRPEPTRSSGGPEIRRQAVLDAAPGRTGRTSPSPGAAPRQPGRAPAARVFGRRSRPPRSAAIRRTVGEPGQEPGLATPSCRGTHLRCLGSHGRGGSGEPLAAGEVGGRRAHDRGRVDYVGDAGAVVVGQVGEPDRGRGWPRCGDPDPGSWAGRPVVGERPETRAWSGAARHLRLVELAATAPMSYLCAFGVLRAGRADGGVGGSSACQGGLVTRGRHAAARRHRDAQFGQPCVWGR